MADPTDPTNDEIATQQAAGGAVGTVGAEPETPATDPTKGWFRANVGWVLAEIDYTKNGKTEAERAALNP